MNIVIPQCFKAINWFDSFMQKKGQWKTNKNKRIQILEIPVPDTAGHTVLLTDCMHMEISGRQPYYYSDVTEVGSKRDYINLWKRDLIPQRLLSMMIQMSPLNS